MNKATRNPADAASDSKSLEAHPGTHDACLARALEDYLARCEAGQPPNREEFLAKHPEVAESLDLALDGLQFLNQFGPQLEDHSNSTGSPAPISPQLPNARLGDFRILREIGRGGMGIVYEAEQEMLGRRVALKVLPFAAMLDERQRMRFKNESRAAATLSHPNIVPVYSVGIERGVQYFAMQFIEGESLASLIRHVKFCEKTNAGAPQGDSQQQDEETVSTPHAQLSTLYSNQRASYYRSIAQIGIKVAEALAHAHDRGIIHRDIKPSNILVESNGQPMIADFGLAYLEGGSDLTLTGDIIGTLRYAPPEQVFGKKSLADARVDIYGLGATLYELLCLQPAFDGPDRQSLMQQISAGSTKRLRGHGAEIPKDLETIVHKSLEADPEDRFESAEEMADELRRFVDHRPLVCRRPGIAQRTAKWVRRHPWPILSVLALTLVILAGVSLHAVAIGRERDRVAAEQQQTALERDRVKDSLRLALDAVDTMYSGFAEAWVSQSQALSNLQGQYLFRSSQLYETIAEQIGDDPEFRSLAGRCLMKSGQTRRRMSRFEEAEADYKQAIELFNNSDNPDDQLDLARTLERLGTLYFVMDRLPDAQASLRTAEQIYESNEFAEQPSIANAILGLQFEQLRIASRMYDDGAVDGRARPIAAELAEKFSAGAEDPYLHVLNLGSRSLWAKSLLRMGNINQALSVCKLGLKQGNDAILYGDDNRYLLAQAAALKAQLGNALQASGDSEAAEQALRDALSLRQSSFSYDGTPREFAFDREVSRQMWEPDAFCDYARIQVSLSRVLRSLDRPDEAFRLADTATRTCSEPAAVFPKRSQYRVDAMIAAAELIRAFQQQNLTTESKGLERLLTWTYSTFRQDLEPSAQGVSELIAAAEMNWEYGRYLARQGRKAEAQQKTNEAIRFQQAVMERLPESAFLRQQLQKYVSSE